MDECKASVLYKVVRLRHTNFNLHVIKGVHLSQKILSVIDLILLSDIVLFYILIHALDTDSWSIWPGLVIKLKNAKLLKSYQLTAYKLSQRRMKNLRWKLLNKRMQNIF